MGGRVGRHTRSPSPQVTVTGGSVVKILDASRRARPSSLGGGVAVVVFPGNNERAAKKFNMKFMHGIAAP
jgi:hypothetical protein